jgi:thioredoxin-like negative regulator of GroEL
VLAEIEHIDDEAGGAGINFVKIDDRQMAKEFGVFALPAVLFFKLGQKDPVIYAGSNPYLKLSRFSRTEIFKGTFTTRRRFSSG